MQRSNIVIIPTISVIQSYYKGFPSDYFDDPLLKHTAHKKYLEGFTDKKSRETVKPDTAFFNACFYNLRKCIEYDIRIVSGTDAGNYAVFYGYSLHHELSEYVAAGMTNSNALRAATENISFIFLKEKIGKIKVGYKADLLVLTKDPLKDISNTKSIDMVIHEGVVLRSCN